MLTDDSVWTSRDGFVTANDMKAYVKANRAALQSQDGYATGMKKEKMFMFLWSIVDPTGAAAAGAAAAAATADTAAADLVDVDAPVAAVSQLADQSDAAVAVGQSDAAAVGTLAGLQGVDEGSSDTDTDDSESSVSEDESESGSSISSDGAANVEDCIPHDY